HLCDIKFVGNISFTEYLTQICQCVQSHTSVLYIKSMIFENITVKFTRIKLGVDFSSLQKCTNKNIYSFENLQWSELSAKLNSSNQIISSQLQIILDQTSLEPYSESQVNH